MAGEIPHHHGCVCGICLSLESTGCICPVCVVAKEALGDGFMSEKADHYPAPMLASTEYKRRVGVVQLPPELFLKMLHLEGGTLLGIQHNMHEQTISLLVEHPEMPETEPNAMVMSVYLTFTTYECGHECALGRHATNLRHPISPELCWPGGKPPQGGGAHALP